MATMPPEEERFAGNINALVSRIYHQLEDLSKQGRITIDLLNIRLMCSVIGAFDKNRLIEGFISAAHRDYWDHVLVEDEEYFINNVDKVFSYIPSQNVEMFKTLYLAKDSTGQPIVDSTFKSEIWRIIKGLIRIAIKYAHRIQGPTLVQGKVVYSSPKWNGQVDIPHHARAWAIELSPASPPK